MLKGFQFILVFLVIGVSFTVPVQSVSAALCDTLSWLDCAPVGPQTGVGVLDLIKSLSNWLFAGFMSLAVVIIVLAGWQFISAGGDPQNMTKARSRLLWAAVAISVALMSKGIPAVLEVILEV